MPLSAAFASDIEAVSISGNVSYRNGALRSGDFYFNTTSGNISVNLPKDASVRVQGHTTSGTVIDKTGKLKVTKAEWGPSSSVRGTLGKGATFLRLSTISGNMSITSK